MQAAIEIPERHGLKNLKPGRGRRWGSRNQIPIDLKRAIIAAAEAYGSDSAGANGLTGYLFHLADRHPKAFARLLEKMVPLQLSGSAQSVVEQVTVICVPAGNFLSKDVPPTDS
jgi:hypothetical protein